MIRCIYRDEAIHFYLTICIINLFNHFMYEKFNLLRTWCNDAVVILIVVRVVLSYPVLLLSVFPVQFNHFTDVGHYILTM